MDREDISKRCVLFKNVPIRTSQSDFRLWLDHVESGAFRDLYLDVQPHIEDKHDKRWIVLFKHETDAIKCIDTKKIKVETPTEELHIVPDYCSECIVPDEWLQRSEDWVTVNKPNNEPFSFLQDDLHMGVQGALSSNESSIHSQDLFSEHIEASKSKTAASKNDAIDTLAIEIEDISVQSSDLFGSDKSRRASGTSVSSSALFGSGRDFSGSLGFVDFKDDLLNKGETSKVDIEKIVDEQTEGSKENTTIKPPYEIELLSKRMDTRERSQSKSLETDDTKGTEIQTEQKSDRNSSVAKKDTGTSEPKQNPTQHKMPVFSGFPYPSRLAQNLQSAEGLPRQSYAYQPVLQQMNVEGSRQTYFPYHLMPAVFQNMMPQMTNQPETQPGDSGQLGQDNVKFVYVPVPVPQIPLQTGGVQGVPEAMIPSMTPGMPPYIPSIPYNMVPFVQPIQNNQMKETGAPDTRQENEGNVYITPMDNTYLTPIDSKPQSQSANRRNAMLIDVKSTERPGVEMDPLGSPEVDKDGYVLHKDCKRSDESKGKQKKETDEKVEKDFANEPIYSSINEETLVGDKTLLKIRDKQREKPPLPPVIQRQPDSKPLSPEQRRTSAAIKNRITIITESSDIPEPSKERWIKLKGIPNDVSQHHLELFIESREISDGAEVQSVKILPEKQEAIIEMKYDTDVEIILKKQANKPEGFKLRNRLVRISRYTPPLVDLRKIFISGMKEGTSKDNLQNFIEVCCNHVPTTVEPGETPGTALLTFNKPIDLSMFRQKIKRRSLEEHFLEISEVEVTSSVKVKGFDPSLSHDTLLYYFENKKRSGGGQVDRVEYQAENNVHIVHFLNSEDAEGACEKLKHEVGKATVTVSLYYPCLDLAPEYRVNKPEALELLHLDPYIVRFLTESSPYRMKFEMQLKKKCRASVVWPKNPDDPVRIVCDLNPADKSARDLIMNWRESCKQEVDLLCSCLDVNDQINVAKEVWDGVYERLRDMTFSDPDMVMVTLKRDDYLIIVFGLKEFVATISQSILDIVSELEQSLSAERQRITKSKTLKTYQAALLRAIRFPEKIKTLSVTMDDRKVEFSGSKKEVDDCIQKMYKKLNEFARRHVTGYTKAAKDLLFEKETRSYLKKATNSKGLLCVWDVIKGSDLVLYSKTDRDLDQVVDIFEKSLKQTTVSLDISMVKLTQTKEWESHFLQIAQEYAGMAKIELKLNEIQIVGVDSVFQKVHNDVMKFFDLHGDISEFMKVEQGRFLYILRNKKRELGEIEKQYQSLHVRVERVDRSNRKGFTTHGKKDGCRLAIKKLQDIVDNITYKDLTISLPGFKEFLLRPEGKLELQNIEISEKCILLPEMPDSCLSSPNEMTKEVASCKIGQCVISVREGDITSLAVDMIVNPSQPSLSQSIGLGSALVDKGGFDIQKECNEHVRKNSTLMDADIFISKGGKLPCKHIIHVVLPTWRGGSNNERTILRQAIEHCLNGAVESNCKSLALPAFGAGLFGYPANVAVRNIIEMIYRFATDRDRSKSINQIYLCDKKSEIVQIFIDELKEKVGSSALKVYKDPDSSYSSGSSSGSSGSADTLDEYNTTRPKITVVVGELVQEKVDVIVNSTNQNLDLRIGIVSRGLVKAGGDTIQKECNDKYPSGIQIGEIAKTTGGALSCQRIYHGVLQIWDGGQGPAENVMGTFIQRCLEEAHREKWKSIAFPALGTGNLGFRPDVVASLLFKCIGSFQSTHLKEVRIVLWHGDTAAVKAFNDVEKLFEKQQRIGRRRYSSDIYQPASVVLQDLGKDFKMAIENVSIQISQGDITRQKTGAIVNSVLKELNLNIGHVSRAILEAGGASIQSECLTQKTKLEKDGLIVTNPGKLLCQKIIHLKAKSTDNGWKTMIYNCLMQVENLGLNSVTFPALGTGGRGNSPEVMAKLMMSSFRQYIGSKDFKQCLKSIRIIIYETSMLETFIKSVTDQSSVLPRVTSKVMDVFRSKSQVPGVKIHVYVDSQNNVENVKSKLEGLFKTYTIYPSKLVLEKMTDREKNLIERKGELQNISVTCSRRKGSVKLEGFGDGIVDVKKDIESYLRKLKKDLMQEAASASVTLPKCWSKMTLKDPMKIELLSNVSSEYVRIYNKFRTEAPGRQVVKIERIQNPTLFTQFIANKHHMERANKGSSFPVERCLWHGTSAGAVESINKTGFNRNFNHGASHGVGVYFAVRASTSLSYCQPDPNGIRHMYYAHVLTGDCCVGSGGIRHPPAKQPSQPAVTYDSTTDNLQCPNFFVIFHDAKAYPSYHIEFL